MDDLEKLSLCFTNPLNDIDARKKAIDSIKDSQELWHTKEYPRFLSVFFDPLVTQLTSTQPQFEDTELHKLRHAVLEVLSKLPPNEVLRPYVPRLLELCLALLNTDNQANGVLALRVLLDLNKNLVRSQVQGYEAHFNECINFIAKVYAEFPATYSTAFVATPATLPTDFSYTHRSLKMVAECPLPLMFMMQLFPGLAKVRLPALLPSMVAAACVRGPELTALPACPPEFWQREREKRERDMRERRQAADPAAEEKWRESVAEKWRELVLAAVADLKTAQVRTVNFLTMVMRNFPAELESHMQPVCSSLFYLFRSAPDSIAVRRELLAATRYILTGPQKSACFAGVLVDILSEGVLLGSSMASMDALKPLAVMTFCEIVHHTRKSFSLEQLGAVVSYLSCCVADRSLPFTTQSTCVRLSLNLVECLYQAFKRPESDLAAKKLAQSLLSKILACFVAKLEALARDIPLIMAAAKEQRAERLAVQASMKSTSSTDTHVVLYLQSPGEKEKEINDCKLIVQNIVFGAKTLLFSILYCTRHYYNVQQHEAAKAAALAAGQPMPPMSPSPPPLGMPEEDVRTCTQLLTAGLSCLKVAAFFGEGKEFCEHFAEIFTVMDPRDFTDVFSVRMGVLFDIMAEDPDALTVAAHLVQNSTVGRVFNALLARYLTDHKLHLLSNHTSTDALLVQKLFRLVFLGLTLSDGESLLVPTLVQMVQKCLAAATQQRDPLAHLQLLRILFKHCHAAREPLQQLYQELAPQLSGALHTLLAILEGPNCTEQLRNLLVELCLLLPAALRVLVELVLLPRLVKPLALALKGPDDLVALGLRTFEVWVDSLNPEYLENALSDVVHDIMGALWALLKPSHPMRGHAMAAMQLLGKLGGRNRKFLRDPAPLDYKDNPEHGLRLILTFRPNTSFLVPLDRCVALAKTGLTSASSSQSSRGAVNSSSDKFYRLQALLFIQGCLAAVLNLRVPEDAGSSSDECRGSAIEKLATVLLEGKQPPMVKPVPSRVELGVKTKTQLVAERSVLTSLLVAVISAAGDEQLGEHAVPFCRHICRHYAMLFAAGATAPPPAPLMSRATGGQQQQQQQQQAAVGQQPAEGSASAGDSAAGAAGHPPQPFPSTMPQGLAELDVHLLCDALIEVLCDANPSRARAAVDALSVFVGTLLKLSAACKEFREQKANTSAGGNQLQAEADVGKDSLAAAAAAGELNQAQVPHTIGDSSGAAEAGSHAPSAQAAGTSSSAQPEPTNNGQANSSKLSPAVRHGLPAVLDDLLPRLLHCCWDDNWSARLGGVAALKLLLHKLPAEYVRCYGPQMLRALLAVVRWLPDHSTVELEEAQQTLAQLLTKCYSKEQIPASTPAAPGENDVKQQPAAGAEAAKKQGSQQQEAAAAASAADGTGKPGESAAPPSPAADGDAISSKPAGAGDYGASGQEPPQQDASRATVEGGSAAAAAEAEKPTPSEVASAAEEQLGQQAATPPATAEVAVKSEGAAAAADGNIAGAATDAGQDAKHCDNAHGSGDTKPQEQQWHAKPKEEDSKASPAITIKPTASLVNTAHAEWGREVAEVLLGVILNPNNSQRSRQTATTGIALLSQLLDVPTGVWLAPVLAAMSPPLMARRIIPVRSVQSVLGQVSALTWVLSVDPTSLTAGPEVVSVAKEAFALADKEEALLLQRLPGRNLSLETLTQLRVACIDLLNVLMAWEPFKNYPEPAEQLRDEITAMMFRALVSDTPAIHNAARRALERIMSVAKIPKHLLQNSLRPILQNLGDYRRLTLKLLHGLGRLLELLSDWFNLTLGERLVEHLKNWLDPDSLLQAGPFQWKSGEEVAIAAAVLDLFWRLPKTAVKFLETQAPPSQLGATAVAPVAAASGSNQLGLVVLTIQLEEKLARMPAATSPLPRILTSEYRLPLLKFLNKYPVEGVAYFLDAGRITNPSYFNMFTALLDMPQAEPLRAQLADSQDKLLSLLGMQQASQQKQPGKPAPEEASGKADGDEQKQEAKPTAAAEAGGAAAAITASAADPSAVASPTAASAVVAQHAGGGAVQLDCSSQPAAVVQRVVQLIELLVSHQPDWLPCCPAIFQALWELWKGAAVGKRRMVEDALLSSGELLNPSRIARCMLCYLAAHHNVTEPLLDLFNCMGHSSSVDMDMVPEYVNETVAKSYSLEHQRAVLLTWAARFKAFCAGLPELTRAAVQSGTHNIFTAGTGTRDEVVQCALISQLVVPLLAAAHKVNHSTELLDSSVLEVLHSVFNVANVHSAMFGEGLRIRMLQLCVELIKAAKPGIAADKRLRDVLIKYAWRYLKVPEESPCRHWAFLATVHLLPLTAGGDAHRQQQQHPARASSSGQEEPTPAATSDAAVAKAPPAAAATGGGSTATSAGAAALTSKGTAAAASGDERPGKSHARSGGIERMVAQVWVSLLRVTQVEPRKGLMREILDVLVPTLVEKLGTRGDDGKVIWVRYAKKQVLDESGTLSNLLQLWQLVVRHPDIFYDSRAQFMSQMINTLSRIGMPHQASLENRKLSLDLAGLLLTWEARKRKAAASGGTAPTAAGGRKRHQPEQELASRAADGDVDTELAEADTGVQEQPAKLIKQEDGTARPSAAAATVQQQQPAQGYVSQSQHASVHGSTPAADDFVLTPEMEHVLVNFLVRMAFLIGESQDKDADMQALHQHTLKLLTQALALFPHISLKLSAFLEKLLQAQASKSPMPALITGWEVMARALDAQPHLLAQHSAKEFVQLLTPCFRLRHQHVVDLMCSAMKKLFSLQPWQEQNPRTAPPSAATVPQAPVGTAGLPNPSDPNATAMLTSGVAVKQEPVPADAGRDPQASLGAGACAAPAMVPPLATGQASQQTAAAVQHAVAVPPGGQPAAGPTTGVTTATPAAVPGGVGTLNPASPTAAAVAAVAPGAPAALTPAVAPATATTPAVQPAALQQPAMPAAPAAATAQFVPQAQPAGQPASAPTAAAAQHASAGEALISIDPNIWDLQNAVLQLVRQCLAKATDPQQNLLVVQDMQQQQLQQGGPVYSSSETLLGICCALSILGAIHEVCPEAVVTSHLPGLVKLLNRCARDVCANQQNAQMHQAHYQQQREMNREVASAAASAKDGSASSVQQQGSSSSKQDDSKQAVQEPGGSPVAAATGSATPGVSAGAIPAAPAASASDIPDAEYATVAWVLNTALVLIGSQAFSYSELKKSVLQSIIIIITANGAKYNEPVLFMRIMLLYQEWLKLPPGLLTIKEAVLLLQRLAYVQDRFDSDLATCAMWHNLFLDIVHGICTSNTLPQELCDEVFSKVERLFLLGLRAADPARRARFFTLYNKHIAAGLFERLQFIICVQEWQSMSGSFWLKSALDLILAVLKEDDPIMLAPNSAQAPPLLPGTRTNVFNPSMQQQQQTAATQQLQPQQQSAAATVDATDNPPLPQQPSAGAEAAAVAAGQDAETASAISQQHRDQQDGVEAMQVDGPATGGGAETPLQPDLQVQPSVAVHHLQPQGSQGVQAVPQQQHTQQHTEQSSMQQPPGISGAPAQGQQQHGLDTHSEGSGFSVLVRLDDVPSSIKTFLEGHVDFLAAAGQLCVRDMMGPLREYAQVDPYVAYHLWVLVFPIVWATLQKQQQINLAKPIISLLSKEYHQRQAMARPNVVQALLEGISLSQPQPKIPPELIKFLGKAFNAWHIAIPLLESHVIIFPDETRCFDALAELYKLVGEDDMMAGLWRRRCCHSSTRIALSLLQLGMVERAQAMLVELNSLVSQGQIAPSARGEMSNGDVPRGEMVLWVDSWVSCTKSLTQWDVLAEYARSTDNLPLVMDCLWRLHDWDSLQAMLVQNQGQMEPAVSSCLLSAYAALREVDTATANAHIDKGFQYALAKWWQLPDAGYAPQVPLLQTFQQLVELRESGRVLMDVTQQHQRADQQYSDTKDIMETWRLRTPNEWDSLVHWQDVLLWRNHIYNVVIGAFNNMQEVAPQLHQMGYRDKAWSVNKLGHIAYKHGCPDVCITVINNMYGYNAMEVQEAFVKIKEQARAYLALPHDLKAGLNMLNTTNLDYFAAHHQAEIFRLKALFMAEPGMREYDAAHSSLSTALCLWRQCPDAWLAWGQLCDARYEENTQGDAALRFLQYAAHCYVQGIKLSTAPPSASGMKTRNEEAVQCSIDLLPRLLHLLSFDDREGVVGVELAKAVEERSLPPWIWFMWIPQLLTSLTRPEVHRIKPILKQLAESHPQAVYYSLRTFVLGLREAAQRALQEYSSQRKKLEAQLQAALQAAGGDADSEAVRALRAELAGLSPSSDTTAFDGGKEVMERLRSQHPVLGSTMEGLLAEVGSKFVPRPLERLLAVVTALLHRCYKLPVANSSPVPAHMRKEMGGVCRACFASDSSKLQGRHMQPLELREGFLHDLDPESKGFPHKLGELAEKLKAWRNRLTTELEAAMPHTLRLEEECRALQDIQLSEIELPGQYLAGHEITPDSCVYLEAISSNVVIVRRNASSFRRLSLLCSDGATRHMLVQTGQNSSQGAADERMMQLLRLLNRLLERSPQARRRMLAWHTPIIVPVWPQVRLFEEEPSYCSYGEAYDINCARFGREPDMPIVHFKKRLATPDGSYALDPDYSLRLAAFTEICDKVVSENIFSQYVYKTLPTCNHLWLFKKHFCSQMALSGLLCYMLLLSGRSPSKILFAKDSGRLFQLDLLPLYNDKGLVERIEVVPYRLTRNLATFFTAFGVEGVFIPAQVAAAGALLGRGGNLPSVLCQFFKEDLLAWTSRKGKGSSSAAVHLASETLKGLVARNTQQVCDRVRHFAPAAVGEDELPRQPVHQNALDLSEAATSPKTLCRMDPTWMPWY